MPTYLYRRKDGSTFETTQRITEDALEECPDTGQPVTRIIQAPSIRFRGNGFYSNDYAGDNPSS